MPHANRRLALQTVLVLLALVAPTSRAATSLTGFPKRTGKPIARSAVAADLSGNGDHALVAVAGDRLVAYGTDGQALAGFPISLGSKDQAVGDPAAADMDGDHKAEVAVATASGKVFLISGGAVAPGFPVKLEAGCAAGPSFADVDGDGKPELLVGDKGGRLHALKKTGKPAPGFPLTLGGVLSSSVSVGVLKGDLALAVGTEEGTVHVVDLHGKSLPGFPLAAHFAVAGAPAFGDLDDDGRIDLAVASKDFNLYAVDEDGQKLRGFPVVAGFAIDGAPALGDLDDDGALDVAFAAADGSVYAVNGKGKVLPGFPVQVKGRVEGGVAIGDLDRSGKNVLVVASSEGAVHAFTGAGKELRGFPSKVPGELTATPFLTKAGKDGPVAVVVGSPDGTLAALRFEGAPGTAALSIVWAGSGHDAARTGRFFPSPGRYKDLAVAPKEPRVQDALGADWHYFSVDGVKEPTVPLAWVKDDKVQRELEGKRELPAGTAKKGERWRFELSLGSRVAKSPDVKVLDTAPTAPEARLTPERPSRATPVRVELAKPSTDADGDKLTYRYAWLVDGVPAKAAGADLPSDKLKKGQRLTAVVIASDGALDSPPGTVEATVANTAPGAPSVALSPAAPKRGDEVKASVAKPAADPDGDALTYRYRWTVDGQAMSYPEARAALPASAWHKGQKLGVSVVAFDADDEGPAATATAAAVNSPPPAPEVAVVPAAPRTGQALRVTVTAQKPDADGDPISYHAAWARNGKPFSAAAGPGSLEVPGAEVKLSDTWSVKVTPNDGEADGAEGKAEAKVRNSPPGAPTVALEPSQPRAAGAVEARLVRPSEDPDGETVRYRYAWTRAGKPVESAKDKTKLGAPDLKKHERVRVTVTPLDAAGSGADGAAEVEVANTPPGAPGIALEPTNPNSQKALKAVVKKPAADDDGDAVSYRFQWYRDGALQSFPESQSEVPASALKKGAHWTVVARAHDGEALGPPATAAATIGNSAPPAPKVTLAPQPPRRGTGLRAQVADAVDPDGDPVSYRYEWRRDGKPVTLPPSASEVSRTGDDSPWKGELWSVDVVASDGKADSPPAHAEVRIANSAPTAPGVSLCDGPIRAGSSPEVTLAKASEDADGDTVAYRYAWTVGGKPAPSLDGKKALTPANYKKRDVLRVAVTPSDGAEDGPTGFAECTVEDTPPTAPEIALEPAQPTAASALKVRIARPATDADGDPVVYRYAWTRDGLPFAPEGAGDQVKAGQLKRGQVLSVTVTSDDGEQHGGAATASAQVANTVPAPPKVSLSPARPVVGAKLVCAVDLPKDADGNPVTAVIAWRVDDKPSPLAFGSAELPAGVVKKNEAWTCEAKSDDGHGVSAAATASVTIANSVPGTPEVNVEPDHPGTGTELRCRVTADARDADGDPVTYRYRWLENGKPVAPGADPTRVAGSQTRRGRKWRCEVTANDGAADGPTAGADRAIGNSPPTPARVALKPRTPRAQQALECELLAPAADPDGDSVTYRYAWFKDGAPQKGSTRPVLAATQVKSGDLWSCQVTASDGELESPPAQSGDAPVP